MPEIKNKQEDWLYYNFADQTINSNDSIII